MKIIQPMDKESLHAARKLRRSFHTLARKILNHYISVQKLDEITERLETIQNEIPAAELPKWWQPETGSGELRSSTYRNRSLYQGPYHLFSPDLDWKEHSGPNGEEGFKSSSKPLSWILYSLKACTSSFFCCSISALSLSQIGRAHV